MKKKFTWTLIGILSLLPFFIILEQADARPSAGGSSSGGRSSGGSYSKGGAVRTGSISGTRTGTQRTPSGNVDDGNYDDGYDADDIIASHSLHNTPDQKNPSLRLHLNIDDEQSTVDGNWTLFFNGQQTTSRKIQGVGSQTNEFPLKSLNPDQTNTIRYAFQGTIDGNTFNTDQTIIIPSFSIQYQAAKLTMTPQQNAKADGTWTMSLRDAKGDIVQSCTQEDTKPLACDISKLKAQTYQVAATFTSSEYTFSKTGTLTLQANKQGTLTLQPAALFPSNKTIETQQANEQWDYAWVKWRRDKVVSPLYPTFRTELQGDQVSTEFIDKSDDQLSTSSTLSHAGIWLIAFYNGKKQLLRTCHKEMPSSYLDCEFPDETTHVTILFAGSVTDYERTWPLGIEQHGTYQGGEFTFSAAQYTLTPKTLQDKIKKISKTKQLAEDSASTTSIIGTIFAVLIFLAILIGVPFLIGWLCIRLRTQSR